MARQGVGREDRRNYSTNEGRTVGTTPALAEGITAVEPDADSRHCCEKASTCRSRCLPVGRCHKSANAKGPNRGKTRIERACWGQQIQCSSRSLKRTQKYRSRDRRLQQEKPAYDVGKHTRENPYPVRFLLNGTAQLMRGVSDACYMEQCFSRWPVLEVVRLADSLERSGSL